ncbi:MAG: acyl-CoA desaturase, partial [Bacteroidota bacterium]
DEDIDNQWMKFSPGQETRWFHKFQLIYAPFLYCLMTIYWFISKDFEQLSRYERLGLYKGQGITVQKATRTVIATKVGYAIFTFVLPLIILPIAWYHVVLGFLLMHFICGLFLALIFQPAHVIEDTDFVDPGVDLTIENSWAIHQLQTTCNFANRSRIFSWFIGGLNFQIEHHLFPGICHVHYRKIAPIVKQTAKEYNVPYYEHKTFAGALVSHFRVLYQLGMDKFPKMKFHSA